MDSSDPDRLAHTLRLLYLLASLAYSLWLIWEVAVPQHQKTAMRMRLLRSSAQGMSQLARLTGERSMALELATGTEAYDLPLYLGLGRDRLMAAYDQARGAS
jgi:hypothetical protein